MRALIVALVAACGGGTTSAPDAPAPIVPREVVDEIKPLQPGELIEAEMKGGSADRVVIKLTAPVAELDWNIHAHPNGGVVTVHEETNKMTATFDFVPDSQADWYLLLRNGGANAMDVEVEVELYGAMTFEWL